MISSRSSLIAMIVLGTVVSMADIGFAQRDRGGGRRGFMGQGGSMAALLRDSNVQEELDLVDDQIEDIDEIQTEMRQEMMEMFRGGGFRDMDASEREERMEEIREKIQERMKEVDAEIGEILLPQQFSRLKELHFQSQVQRGGTVGLAGNDTIADALGITEEQKAKMKKVAEAAAKKLDEKIKDLRQQAQDEVLAVLTSEQRKMLKDLKGDSFEFGNERGRVERAERGDRGRRGERGGRGNSERGGSSESDGI